MLCYMYLRWAWSVNRIVVVVHVNKLNNDVEIWSFRTVGKWCEGRVEVNTDGFQLVLLKSFINNINQFGYVVNKICSVSNIYKSPLLAHIWCDQEWVVVGICHDNIPLVAKTPHPPGQAREPINAQLDPFMLGMRIWTEMKLCFL